jgi:hypothetical protein
VIQGDFSVIQGIFFTRLLRRLKSLVRTIQMAAMTRCRIDRSRAFQTCAALIIAAVAGCGAPRDGALPVRGKVTMGGAPLAVKGREIGLGYVEMHFYRIRDEGSVDTEPADAAVEESGEFTVRGRDGHGLAPGKYKITVRQLDPAPDNDKLGGRFNRQNSRIVREVSGEEIVIDLSRPEG